MLSLSNLSTTPTALSGRLTHANPYVGLCMEFPWLSREAPTAREAIAAVEGRVTEMVAGMEAGGEGGPSLAGGAKLQRQDHGAHIDGTSRSSHDRSDRAGSFAESVGGAEAFRAPPTHGT